MMGTQHRYDPSVLTGALLQAYKLYGGLTAAELAQLNKGPMVAEPRINVAKLESAFAHAKSKGVKFPKIVLNGFQFKPAPLTGANPGAVYVVRTSDDTYLGKVLKGFFNRSFKCSDEESKSIADAAEDPLKAVIAFGKRFGKCAICNRTLTDPESIDRGIGPICVERMVW